MPDRPSSPLPRLLAVAALMLLAHTATAAAGTLYKVELIVFNDSSGVNAEQWEAIPDLDYPGNVRFLNAASQTSNKPPPQVGDAGPAEEVSTPPGPSLYTTLPADQQAFRGKAAYMKNTGRYRILFHETWIQPIESRAQALPLVLDRSGDTMQWPVLQGTIKLYVARYLYLETNLWMNTDGQYLQSTWQMPAPPLGPKSVSDRAPAPTTVDTVAEVNVYDLHTQQEPLNPQTGAQTVERSAGPIYPFRHAVLLKQSRRMRSGEVHYIDHPMLGVIVKVTPLGE